MKKLWSFELVLALIALLFIALLTLIIACNSKKATTTVMESNQPLNNTYWKLLKVDGFNQDIPSLQKEAFIRFDSASSKFSGTAGCNRMMGGFVATGNTIKIGPSAVTKMMCPSPLMELEDAFSKAIYKADTYSISGKKLQLKNGESVLAEFEAGGN
ncbi:META domain-containing protein [Chitinophagaceae bacterium 26-R-25]|nr:META domain-containing protein [Chitinophagaceae bacterium 26-R-25]